MGNPNPRQDLAHAGPLQAHRNQVLPGQRCPTPSILGGPAQHPPSRRRLRRGKERQQGFFVNPAEETVHGPSTPGLGESGQKAIPVATEIGDSIGGLSPNRETLKHSTA